jgi:hypothetical protein
VNSSFSRTKEIKKGSGEMEKDNIKNLPFLIRQPDLKNPTRTYFFCCGAE